MVDDVRDRMTKRRDYTKEIIGGQPTPPHHIPPPEAKKPKKWPKIVLNNLARLVVVTLLIVAALIGWQHFHSSSSSKSSLSPVALQAFQQAQQNVSFPLYYPTKLPMSFKLDINSISSQDSILNFYYNYGTGKKVIVTEQAKPPLTEEVSKIKEFNTPIGRAYIANLDGSIAGFVSTDKTLLIFTIATQSDSRSLEQLMQSLQELN